MFKADADIVLRFFIRLFKVFYHPDFTVVVQYRVEIASYNIEQLFCVEAFPNKL